MEQQWEEEPQQHHVQTAAELDDPEEWERADEPPFFMDSSTAWEWDYI